MPSVLIVGAGPTGLTAAVELARLGADLRVIEARPGPSPLSRAVGISARSMQILRPSGVAAAIDAEAVRFAGIRIHDGARLLAQLPLNFDDRTRLWGLAQDRTEHHLAEALRRLGHDIAFGRRCTAVRQDGQSVTADTADGPLRAEYLIAADGTHSTVRQSLGLAYDGIDLPGDWSIADVDAPDWPHPDCFQGFLLPEGNVAVVVPMAPARFRVIASLPDALAALPVPMPATQVRRAGTFRISVREVARYRLDRVLLAGDAAHCHSPVGGRGMNLGIADAAEAAARLVTGDLDDYDASRMAEGRHVLRFSETGRRMLQAEGATTRSLLRTAIRLAGAIPPLGRAAMRRFVSG